MASLEELRAYKRPAPVVPPETSSEGEELLENDDIMEAINLLNKCKNLLSFLADRDLCVAISARERMAMYRVTEMVKAFLDDAEEHYE